MRAIAIVVLAACLAPALRRPVRAVPPPPPPSHPTAFEGSIHSPDGQWEAYVLMGTVMLHRLGTNIEHQITRDRGAMAPALEFDDASEMLTVTTTDAIVVFDIVHVAVRCAVATGVDHAPWFARATLRDRDVDVTLYGADTGGSAGRLIALPCRQQGVSLSQPLGRVIVEEPFAAEVRSESGEVLRRVSLKDPPHAYSSIIGVVAIDPTGHSIVYGTPILEQYESSTDYICDPTIGFNLAVVDVDTGIETALGEVGVHPDVTFSSDATELRAGGRRWKLESRSMP